jgi:hypothetical protein
MESAKVNLSLYASINLSETNALDDPDNPLPRHQLQLGENMSNTANPHIILKYDAYWQKALANLHKKY